jgi:hypothetical protein
LISSFYLIRLILNNKTKLKTKNQTAKIFGEDFSFFRSLKFYEEEKYKQVSIDKVK